MIEIKNKKFKNCLKELFKFEKDLSKKYISLSSSNKSIKEKGYLLHKAIIDDLKAKLYYNELFIDNKINKEEFNKKFTNVSNVICNIKCEQKIFNSFQDLKESLERKNEFIIINNTILLLFGLNAENIRQNIGDISYEINNKNLILFINSEKIIFKHNANIINEKSFIKVEKLEIINNNEIDNILQSIKEYYTFDTLLIKELKETKEKSEKNIKGGYLINKKWIDKWKTYTHYENIKKEFLSEGLNPENDEQIKETIIKRNIYNQDFNMGDIDVFNFNSSSEIQAHLQKESIILVGEKFYKLFIEKSKDKIKFSSNKRMITIYFNKNINKDKDKYDIEAYNNILSLDINNCNKMIDNLIKIYIFQEQLKLKMEKEKYLDNNVFDIKLVDKKWITSIKKKYNFSHLLEIIKDKKEIKDEIKKLDISNYNPILSKIQKEIPEDYFYEIYNNIDIIKENDKNIKFTLENKSINIELSKMFNKNKKREYLVNIELIDCQLYNPNGLNQGE